MGKKKDAGTKKLGKKLRGLERKLSTYDYLMKVTQFDGATIAPENGAAARGEGRPDQAAERGRSC